MSPLASSSDPLKPLRVYGIRHGQALHNVIFDQAPPETKNRDLFFGDLTRDSPLTVKGHREALDAGGYYVKDSDATTNNFVWNNNKKEEVVLVLVSPLSRTLQTASNLWRNEIEAAGFCFPEWVCDGVKEDAQCWESISKIAAEESTKRSEKVDEDTNEKPVSWGSSSGTDNGFKTFDSISGKSNFLYDGAIGNLRKKMKVRFIALDQLREFAFGMSGNERRSKKDLEKLFPWVDFSYLQSDKDLIFEGTLDEKVNTEGFDKDGLEYKEAIRGCELSGGGYPGEGEWEPQLACYTKGEKNKYETVPCFCRRIRDFKRIVLDKNVLEGEKDIGSNQSSLSINLRNLDPKVSNDYEGFHSKRLPALYDLIHSVGESSPIALVSHSGYLGKLCFNVFGDENRPLKHVFPYQYIIDKVEQSAEISEKEWEGERF